LPLAGCAEGETERVTSWSVPVCGPKEPPRQCGRNPYRPDPDARSVRIHINTRGCWVDDDKQEAINRIEVRETETSVTITAYVNKSTFEGDCLTSVTEAVHLEAPLGDRELMIGGDKPRKLNLDDPA
jgi:hypothetical protein